MTDRVSRLAAGLLAIALGAVPGCGEPTKPATVPVAGKVMFKKTTPTAGALVVFHPADPTYEKRIGGKPHATVKDDGTFVLTTYAPDDGAPEGEYGVTVDWRGKSKDPKFEVGFGDGKSSGQPLLNPKYGDPQHPVLKATVKKGQANEFTFDVD
jgi:hypothetical protein